MSKKESADKQAAEQHLYDKLRFAAHDIIRHCLTHWKAFSEAAEEVGLTPALALASVVSKAAIEILSSEGLMPR